MSNNANNGNKAFDDDLRHAILQVDHFIELMDKRYGITPQDVVEAVKWVQQRQKFYDKLQNGSVVTVITMVLTTLGYFIMKGFENLYRGQ